MLRLFILTSLLTFALSEMFTALVHMEKALVAESEVAKDLKDYIAREEQRLLHLKQVAESYEKHSSEALKDVMQHLSNPVNAFLLVKRFTADWAKVEDLIKSNMSQDFLSQISSKTSSFPTEEDLSGAASALLRLQDTYSLPTHEIAKGQLQGVKHSPTLTAVDCYELGRQSYLKQDYYHTILWMEQALEVLESEGNSATIDKALLYDYLSYSTYVQGNLEHALELTDMWLALEPDHIRAQNNKKYYIQLIAERESQGSKRGDTGDAGSINNPRPLDDYRSGSEFNTYEALCRDENIIPNPNQHQLYCQYKRHRPMFYIRPLKEEVMYFNPWIVVYHDVMTDAENEAIRSMAAPRLDRATVQNSQTGKLEYANYRISKSMQRCILIMSHAAFDVRKEVQVNAWLKDWESDVVARVSHRVGTMVNLTLETVEELQVVNYGIGGHYEPHYDFARREEKSAFEKKVGNRILTAIYYLTDVPAGGFTVFPIIGVKLKPMKNACAVWYNLKPSGDGDYDTRHAACPVLAGNKWVANKWFHERGQEFSRPCALRSNAPGPGLED